MDAIDNLYRLLLDGGIPADAMRLDQVDEVGGPVDLLHIDYPDDIYTVFCDEGEWYVDSRSYGESDLATCVDEAALILTRWWDEGCGCGGEED